MVLLNFYIHWQASEGTDIISTLLTNESSYIIYLHISFPWCRVLEFYTCRNESTTLTTVTLETYRQMTSRSTNGNLTTMIYQMTVEPLGNSVRGIPTGSNPNGVQPGQCFISNVQCQ